MELKETIQKKGLKQKWIAEQIGINVNTFRAYLNNLRNMPQDVSDKVKALIGN